MRRSLRLCSMLWIVMLFRVGEPLSMSCQSACVLVRLSHLHLVEFSVEHDVYSALLTSPVLKPMLPHVTSSPEWTRRYRTLSFAWLSARPLPVGGEGEAHPCTIEPSYGRDSRDYGNNFFFLHSSYRHERKIIAIHGRKPQTSMRRIV